MRGKVIFYDSSNGAGKIIATDGQKIPFNIDGWLDYDVMPETGLEVVFSLEGSSAVAIKVGQLGGSAKQNEGTSRPRIQGGKKEALSTFGETKGARKTKALIAEIGLNKDIDESLDEYFGEFYGVIARNQEAVDSPRKLDFFRIKRFLNTAYHNLKQLDRSISEGKFKEIDAELRSLHRLYRSFTRITSLPMEVAYEIVFLEQQEDYKEAQAQIKSLKNDMQYAKRLEKSLKSVLDHKEMLLKEPSLSEEKAALLESQIKPIRRDYTDAMYEAARSKEDIVEISKAMEQFKREYIDRFATLFKQNVAYAKEHLLAILDAKAYEFDYMLWSNAKESPYIRKFFTECKIEGSYCSKTFLSYYMRSLDKNKLTEENQGYADLLAYLEKNFTKRVIVVAKDYDFAEYIKALVEKIDKDITVIASTSPVDMINYAKKNSVDLVILELELRLMDGFSFIGSYASQVKTATEFCVIYDQSMAKTVEKIGENSIVKKFIKKQSKEVQMLESIKRVL